MPVRWDSDSELKLTMAIIKATNVKPKASDNVASMLGDTYTGEGVRQHYQKMLKRVTFAANASSSSQSASAISPTALTTSADDSVKALKNQPSSRGVKPKVSPMKRKKNEEEEAEETEGEQEEDAEVAIKAKRIKKDHRGDDDE
ncbi:hypothetical protein MMC26_003593 [Xylographa opegraphella]|nr:hypothetical protein [Xylographa opegraphella]